MTAWEMKLNDVATIVGFLDESHSLVQRLGDLGFKVGDQIVCLKVPPFQGPKVFNNCNGVFSLEKEVANIIEVRSV